MDDEAGGEDVLVHAKVDCRVLDAMQLGHVAGRLSDDVEPELLVEVAGLSPLVGREADGPGAGAGLDLDVADGAPIEAVVLLVAFSCQRQCLILYCVLFNPVSRSHLVASGPTLSTCIQLVPYTLGNVQPGIKTVQEAKLSDRSQVGQR